jgi:hypothetical protein
MRFEFMMILLRHNGAARLLSVTHLSLPVRASKQLKL